eukprot:SAG11_NODE_1730_length_4364_cov_1.545369_4_plen_75_part_00
MLCRARERLEEVMEVVPNNLGPLSETEHFSHDLIYPPEHEALLRRCLAFEPLQTQVAPGAEGQPLRFKVSGLSD